MRPFIFVFWSSNKSTLDSTSTTCRKDIAIFSCSAYKPLVVTETKQWYRSQLEMEGILHPSHFLVVACSLFAFWNRVSLYCLGWPWTHNNPPSAGDYRCEPPYLALTMYNYRGDFFPKLVCESFLLGHRWSESFWLLPLRNCRHVPQRCFSDSISAIFNLFLTQPYRNIFLLLAYVTPCSFICPLVLSHFPKPPSFHNFLLGIVSRVAQRFYLCWL